MNKPQPEVKTACEQTDFATDGKPEKEVIDLVLEHNPTKPEQASVANQKSPLDSANNDALDEKPLADKK